jgi:hypothetical protein
MVAGQIAGLFFSGRIQGLNKSVYWVRFGGRCHAWFVNVRQMNKHMVLESSFQHLTLRSRGCV